MFTVQHFLVSVHTFLLTCLAYVMQNSDSLYNCDRMGEKTAKERKVCLYIESCFPV